VKQNASSRRSVNGKKQVNRKKQINTRSSTEKQNNTRNSPGGGRLIKSKTSPGGGRMGKSRTAVNGMAKENEKLKANIEELLEQKKYIMQELETISSTAKAIEGERDFYYNTLLKVETMCRESTLSEQPEIQKILNILYSSNEGTPRESKHGSPQIPMLPRDVDVNAIVEMRRE